MNEKSISDAPIGSSINEDDARDPTSSEALTLPSHVAGSGTLDRLAENARDYAKASTAENTNKAYAADWKHFARWCRLKGAEPLPPSPEMIGLYLTDLAAPTNGSPALSVSTLDRRLSGLAWNYAQRGFALDRKDDIKGQSKLLSSSETHLITSLVSVILDAMARASSTANR